MGVKKRSHVYYTIGAAGLGLAALELVYPRAFGAAAIAADLALIPVAVWAAAQYERGRLDRYSQGLVAIVVAIILLTGVSMSLAPRDLYDIMLGAGILAAYLVLGALYYLARRRGIRLADLNLCSMADRRILYASMAVGLLVSVILGGLLYAPLAYVHRAKLGHSLARDEFIDWVIIASSTYTIYWLMEWSVGRCLALRMSRA
ncbi:MAG: hypothetical protein GSR80_000032 [Desulfurococcales archaeon]|nr:hypothetical protein [Desulfurococcales archaeon]